MREKVHGGLPHRRHQVRHEGEFVELEVGTIIVATGFDKFDPARLSAFAWNKSPNIIDGLQFERMSSATGPTKGEILTKEGKKPERVAIIHCVGSRDANANVYCSRVCCMYALKHAHLVRDKTGAEVFEFYMDIRAFGKGYEEFYERVQEEGVYFVRGRGAEVVVLEDGQIQVKGEDTTLGLPVAINVDMVVLDTAMEPQHDAAHVGSPVRPQPQCGRLFPGSPPQAAPVPHQHRRRLSGRDLPVAQGRARHGGPRQRCRRRGPVAPQPGEVVISPQTALRGRGSSALAAGPA